MYPFIRLVWQLWKHRKDTPIGVTDTHVSHHICMPWDLDFWNELNNGRTLTLFDMGRLPLAARAGLIGALRKGGWALTMAGCSVRYRKRVRGFDRLIMKSRCLCWDERFMYLEQSMWRPDGTCTSHVLYRSAVTGRDGIVPIAKVIETLGYDGPTPEIPEWVAAWIAAEAVRPWPPMQDTAQDRERRGACKPDSRSLLSGQT
jgi:acyl-CoA thioesterase FadM